MASSRSTLDLLRQYESRNVTFLDPDGAWPVVWSRARGMLVWDERGRRYLDFTAAFGVAAAGHANARVIKAGQAQMATLVHAMGDVHPHPAKGRLVRELSRVTFERWHRGAASKVPAGARHGRTILGNSGFEAVEAALKTARLATGKRGVIAFHGAYHGLGYGALNATHREHFRGGFTDQLGCFGHFVDYPTREDQLEGVRDALGRCFHRHEIGAVLVEPIQGRGGNRVPPAGFLPMLREVCDAEGALLMADEIYTGFGRTGKWFACEHSGVVPDVICLGKALTGGFPLSACVGRADWMDRAWPASQGEAIHTSTFLGHPVGCAMALAQLAELRRLDLVRRSAGIGRYFLKQLRALPVPEGWKAEARGMGLMIGMELWRPGGEPATEETLGLVKRLLHRGFVLLPEGERGNVLSLTPPLIVTRAQVDRLMGALRREMAML